MPAAVAGSDDPSDGPGGVAEHDVVFRQEGRNPGWAAAVGKVYRWDNELLFAFYDYKYLDDPRTANEHNTDETIPTPVKLARSLDGGATWTIEYPKYPGATAGVLDLFEDPGAGPAPVNSPGGIDFSDPDFAMVVRVTANCTSTVTCRNPNGNRPFTRYHNNYDGPTGARSWFVYTTDRGQTWSPRYWLPAAPDLGPYFGVRARTDYVVNGPNEMQLFMAVDATQDVARSVLERGVISIRTTDGGRTWTRDGEMTPFEPAQQRIMPSTVRVDDDTLVSAVREATFTGADVTGAFEVYRSDDDGRTWTYLNTPVEFGPSTSPPALVLTDEGHLVLTYGNRTTRQLEAVVSTDGGSTWGDVVVGRSGAAHFDISYPRSVLLDDGDILTVYHWNDPGTSPDCDENDDDEPTYVAATTWNPETLTPAPETPPVVELTDPASGTIPTGTVTLRASATDDVGVSKVEFLVDGEVRGADRCAPHSLAVNTSSLSSGSHTLTARATDTAGATTESAPVEVTASGSTPTTTSPGTATKPPARPASLRATSTARTSITVAWNASGGKPTGYRILRNEVVVGVVDAVSKPTYTDAGLAPNTSYKYKVKAFNGAGTSLPSTAKKFRTKP